MSLIINSSKVLITRLLKLVISLGTGILLARWLQPEWRGAYSLITQFYLFTVAFSGMSVGYASIHYSGDDRYTTEDQIVNGVNSALIFALVSCSLILLFRKQLNLLFPLSGIVLLIVIFLVPFGILDSSWRAILQSKYKFSWVNALEIIQSIVLAIGLLTGYIFFKATIHTAIVIWAVSIIIPFLILVIMILSLSPIKFSFKKIVFIDHLKFGIKAHLSTVIGLLSLRFDQYLLGYLTSTKDVGVYAVAVTLSELLWFIPSSVSFVLLPKMAHGCERDSALAVKRISTWIFLISIVSALILAIVARPLIVYGFGNAYKASLMALWLLLPGVVMVSITTVTTPFFLGRLGRPELGALVAGSSLVSNIILNILLIPRYGVNGAAASSSISYGLATILNIALFFKSCNYITLQNK